MATFSLNKWPTGKNVKCAILYDECRLPRSKSIHVSCQHRPQQQTLLLWSSDILYHLPPFTTIHGILFVKLTSHQTNEEIMNSRRVHSFCPSRLERQLQCVTSQTAEPHRRPSLSVPDADPTERRRTSAEPAGGNCQTTQQSSRGSVAPFDRGCPSLSRQHLRSWDKFCSRH